MEIWKPIKGYEGLYEISNYGRVKSLARTWVTGHNSIVRSKDESILAPKKRPRIFAGRTAKKR
jgi:NUMOD4 motif.